VADEKFHGRTNCTAAQRQSDSLIAPPTIAPPFFLLSNRSFDRGSTRATNKIHRLHPFPSKKNSHRMPKWSTGMARVPWNNASSRGRHLHILDTNGDTEA
jgi:hypothetical protein